MASQLTRDDVARIASLAQLDLSASELDTFARQLADIVTYAAIVQQADTSAFAAGADAAAATADKPALSFAEGATANRPADLTGAAHLRLDAPLPSLDRTVVLAEAPDAASGLFRVPKVR